MIPFAIGATTTGQPSVSARCTSAREASARSAAIPARITKQRAQYSRAFLHSETDDNDLTYFAIYHLEVIRRATDALHAYLQRKSQQERRLEALAQSKLDLNHRQRALLGKALRSPDTEFTVKSHQNSHRVVYETARSDLLDLVDAGLMLKSKRGRKFVFRAPNDLDSRLRGANDNS